MFPTFGTKEEYGAALERRERWLPGVREICRRHGLPTAGLEPLPVGSNVVFAAGTRVVKTFAPFWPREAAAERAMLAAVDGRLGVPTPALEAEGELDGWRYLVMGRIEGVEARVAWRTMEPSAQADVLRELGAALARLHRLDVPGLASIPPSWTDLLRDQRAAFAARQRVIGLPEAWIAEAEPFLDRLLPPLARAPCVPIHADLTWENVFLAERGGRWRVSGLLDFADAMLGPVVYELVGPSSHWLPRRADLGDAFLSGYGIAPAARGDLPDAFLACALLHRFIDLRRTVDRSVPGPPVASLEELRDALCPAVDVRAQ